MRVSTQLSVPSNFEKPKRTVRLLGRITNTALLYELAFIATWYSGLAFLLS